ncbi:EndoU domain-containing protein [Priestia megaterium]
MNKLTYKNAMALYQIPKAFKTLQQTEKGLYGLLLMNGMYEYTMGKDLLGKKLTKEEKQTSLLQAAGGLLGVGISVKGTAGIAQGVKQAVELSGFLKRKVQYNLDKLSAKNLGSTPQERLAFAEKGKNINTLSSTYVKNVASEINDSTMMLFSRSSEGAQSIRGVTPHTVEHVFHGQINRRGKAVGYHHESMMGGGKIVEIIDPPDSRGIYRAKISVKGINKTPLSTFFPKEWNKAQVLNEINEAYENKRIINRQSGLYAGRTSNGLTIRMYINSEGKIDTAFPIRERGGNQ